MGIMFKAAEKNTLFFVICLVSVAIMLIAFGGGISVGSSNHVGLIPVVRWLLDPEYLPGDFGIAVRLYHHRVFAFLVAGLVALFGEDNALIVLNIIGKCLLSCALWYLCCRAMKLPLIAFLIAGLFISLNVGWVGRGLELNDFVGDSQVMPPLFAHALVLLGVATLMQHRYQMTAFLAGLATLIHLQIGIIFVLTLLPFYVVQLKSFRAQDVTRLAALFLVPAWPSLWHLFQMMGRGLAHESFSQNYIDFRHPHHFELISTEAAAWVATHLLLQAVAYWYVRRERASAARFVGVLLAISATLAVLAILHFLDYYLVHGGTVMKLQFIRLSPFMTVFGLLSFLTCCQVWADQRAEPHRCHQFINASSGALLVMIIAAWVFYDGETIKKQFYFGVRKYAEEQSSWVDVCRWVAQHGPRAAVYLTPPGSAGFTYLANRSNVAEFKINPDGGLYLTEWFARLRDLTGDRLPVGRGFENRKPLNAAFASLGPQQLIDLGGKYHAEYAVLPKSSAARFQVLYENHDFLLVKLAR